MSGPEATDHLVIGGGIVGITVALELKRRFPGRRIDLIEKEPAPGAHASGRNSGVIHAGFYYSADSLKARFCRDGNRELRAYCRAKGLPLDECGKLVVARDAADQPGLDELLRRGRANAVEVHEVSAEEARRREPRALTHGRALWSPGTASADPAAVIAALAADAAAAGVGVHCGEAYRHREDGGVVTDRRRWAPAHVVNCAGLYADRIAHDFGVGARYTILPFKGLYLYAADSAPPLRVHIYPVPDLAYPFLGVHFTVTVDGHHKLGPTAIPAFWRENYGGLQGFSPGELVEILGREAGLMLRAGFDFRGLARQELRKFSRSYLADQAARLASGVRRADFRRWGRPGIRAQLLDRARRTLVMDFVIEQDGRSLHVLNAVSPAWTCSFPFARHVVDRIAAG